MATLAGVKTQPYVFDQSPDERLTPSRALNDQAQLSGYATGWTAAVIQIAEGDVVGFFFKLPKRTGLGLYSDFNTLLLLPPKGIAASPEGHSSKSVSW